MSQVTRRFFLLSSAALSIGCAVRRPATVAASSTPGVRQPAIGQMWRYSQYDLFTRALVVNQVDRVNAISSNVEIASSTEPVKDQSGAGSRWGTDFLRRYVAHRDKPAGALPSEIQHPWGMVLVDPHWGDVQVYEKPIPLWPEELRPGWQGHVSTRYKTPSHQDPLQWDQAMKAHDWETITVPAGQFRTLRYTNMIQFRNGDIERTDSIRQETLWFAPEIGRWVARESSGSYYMDDSVVDQPYNENGFRWELIEWA